MNLTATKAHPSAAITDAPKPKYRTREQYLRGGLVRLARVFKAHGYDVPKVRVSVGWPGGTRKMDVVIGQCWAPVAAADGMIQIYVSPLVDNPHTAVEILAHELVHAVMYANGESGHGRGFWTIAEAIGLDPATVVRNGKTVRTMTSTHAGEALSEIIDGIVTELGTFPHGALTRAGLAVARPKQSTRLLLAVCEETGYKVRITRKWLDEYGAPICPCHGEVMTEQ